MRTVLVTDTAANDFLAALKYSQNRFGTKASERYSSLIVQAFQDLAEDAKRPGTSSRSDLCNGVYFYHLKHSRKSLAKRSAAVHHPRHFIVFRLPSVNELHILRIVHERRKFDQLRFIEEH